MMIIFFMGSIKSSIINGMVLPEPVPAITNRVQTKNNSLSYIKRSRVISAHKLKTLSAGKCRYQMWILPLSSLAGYETTITKLPRNFVANMFEA